MKIVFVSDIKTKNLFVNKFKDCHPRFSTRRRKKTPEKAASEAKKSLFGEDSSAAVAAANVRHVPLTEERKMDPDHEPYYVINFENIVRGVIDHSDDKRLFDESDLTVVDGYRGMGLDARNDRIHNLFHWISDKIKTKSYHGSLKSKLQSSV